MLELLIGRNDCSIWLHSFPIPFLDKKICRKNLFLEPGTMSPNLKKLLPNHSHDSSVLEMVGNTRLTGQILGLFHKKDVKYYGLRRLCGGKK